MSSYSKRKTYQPEDRYLPDSRYTSYNDNYSDDFDDNVSNSRYTKPTRYSPTRTSATRASPTRTSPTRTSPKRYGQSSNSSTLNEWSEASSNLMNNVYNGFVGLINRISTALSPKRAPVPPASQATRLSPGRY